MNRINRVEFRFVRFAAVVGLLLICSPACSEKATSPKVDTKTMAYQLSRLTGAQKIPGAAGLVTDHSATADIQASGVRRVGQNSKVTTADLYHIGSLTKFITATMIGTLVEDGILAWDSKPADVISGLDTLLDSGYASITLLDLLHHRAGIPSDDDFDSIPTLTGTLKERREKAARIILSAPPAVTPGTFRYSNAGYAIAASMAEAATGQDWRTLMNSRLFTPLGINAFYGWPTEHDANQPWGHILVSGQFQAVEPSIEPDELDILEPAGFISMSLEDYAKFIRLQMNAMQGSPQLLTAATFQTLRTPVGDYACGIQVMDTPSGPLYWHNGSNTFFYVVLYLVPTKNVAVVVAINAGDESLFTSVGVAAESVLEPLIE